jgi:hypothetical protein
MKFLPLLVILLACSSPSRRDFLTTKGKIVRSNIEKEFPARSAYLGRLDFKAELQYQYSVEGKQFQSSSIRKNQVERFNSSKKAETYLFNYPKDKEVTVFFLKNSPNISYLELDEEEVEDDEN